MVGPGLRCAGGAAPTHVQPRAILGVPGGQDVVEAAERTRDLLHLVIAERVAVPRLEGRTDGADGFGREAGGATAHAGLRGEVPRGDGEEAATVGDMSEPPGSLQ